VIGGALAGCGLVNAFALSRMRCAGGELPDHESLVVLQFLRQNIVVLLSGDLSWKCRALFGFEFTVRRAYV
jgi:hypothetical protein